MWNTEIKLIDWSWLLLVATLSFFVSGLPYYPFLNSDIAVHVLMTESFSFRYDLYFWGQDRLGSLLPMLSNIAYRFSGLSPFWLTALTKWFFLCLGCVSFWFFIPNRLQRWIWTCLWFFPAYEMMYHLLPGHPYAEQMAMFGLSFIFFCRWIKSTQGAWNLPLFLLFATISFWVSDFSLVFYVVIFLAYFSSLQKQTKQLLSNTSSVKLIPTIIVLVLGVLFILYAKFTAARDETYTLSMFGSFNQVSHSISMLWFYTKNALMFKSVSIWNSILFYATSASLIVLIRKQKQLRKKTPTKVFFVIASLGFLLIVSLRWLAINFVMLKYFIPVFFSLWLGILSIDFYEYSMRLRNLASTLMILVAISCVGSILYQYRHASEQFIEIADLRSSFFTTKKSIIGDYWYSYVFAVSRPDLITTSPHDLSSVRNWKQVNQVMASDTIYICLNDWMESAPEQLTQFDTPLVLIDNQNEGQFRFARYKKLENN